MLNSLRDFRPRHAYTCNAHKAAARNQSLGVKRFTKSFCRGKISISKEPKKAEAWCLCECEACGFLNMREAEREEGNRCHAPCVHAHVAVYGLNPRPVVLLHNIIFSGKDEFTVF